MFKPVEMCKINVLLLNKHLTDTTRKLGALGNLHLVDAVAQSESGLLGSLDDEHNAAALRLGDEFVHDVVSIERLDAEVVQVFRKQ